MSELVQAINWLGSPAQIGTFAVGVVIALSVMWPKIRQQDFDREARIEAAKTAEIAGYKVEVAELRKELKLCEEECAAKLKVHEDEIRDLQEARWGDRKQHLAEQISLINVILRNVESPELRNLLKMFESVKASLVLQQVINREAEEGAKDEGASDDKI